MKITPVEIMPTKSVLDKIGKLTAENYHGECYEYISKWCKDHARESTNAKMKFELMESLFHTINKQHQKHGILVDFTVRYDLGKKLDEYIIGEFGEKVLEKLNEPR